MPITIIKAKHIKNLQTIHQSVIVKDVEFRNKNSRLQYFLAACGLIDPDLDLAVALKLRPHGGVIGVDDSRLDYFLGISKVFRLHAILHDASGFVKDYTDKGPGYVYAVDICNINNCLFGHLSGLGFCLYVKYFKSDLFRTLEC